MPRTTAANVADDAVTAMRYAVLLSVVVACSDNAPPKRADWVDCPRGTVHKGGYPLGEFCQIPGGIKRDGPERHFHPGSRIVSQEWTWVDGEIEGQYVNRWPNGLTAYSGAYHAGKRVGVWRNWTERGEISSEASYDDNGEEHGLALSFGGVTSIELDCFEHGRLMWNKRWWDGKGGYPPACPGPPPEGATLPPPAAPPEPPAPEPSAP